MFLYILFLLLCCQSAFGEFFGDEEAWVNPINSFFGSADEVIKDSKAIYHSSEACSLATYDRKDSEDGCTSFLSRFVNIILLNTGLKNYYMRPEEELKTVTVDITVSKYTLSSLQRFSAGEKVSYKELDDCFVSFFEVVGTKEKKDDFVLPTSSYGHNEIVLMVLFVILLVVIFRALRNGINFTSAVVFCFLIYYVIRVGQSLWTQYEDIYAQQIVAMEGSMGSGGSLKIPDECFPSRLNFWDRFYYNVISNDNPCKRYLKSKKSIFSELDIEKAVTEPIYGLIMSALPVFGDSAGKSVNSFTAYFPFPLNLILPVVIIYSFFSSVFPSIMWGAFSMRPLSMAYRAINKHQAPSITSSAPSAGLGIAGGIPHTLAPSVPSTIVNNYFTSPPAREPINYGPSTSKSTIDALNEIKNFRKEKKLHAILSSKFMKRKQKKNLPHLSVLSPVS